MNDQDRIKSFLNNLAATVIGAIKNGTVADRKRLIGTLRDLDAHMPGISEDTAGAKEFLHALVSLLDGNPISPEGLPEPYAGMYGAIIKETLSAGRPERLTEDMEVREFLTQVAATVVLVMRTGTEENKGDFAGKLREIHKAMPQEKGDARALMLAFVSLLEGSPVDAGALSEVYAHFYSKVVESIKSGSR